MKENRLDLLQRSIMIVAHFPFSLLLFLFERKPHALVDQDLDYALVSQPSDLALKSEGLRHLAIELLPFYGGISDNRFSQHNHSLVHEVTIKQTLPYST